ncbi:hypothetical protein GCM10018966_097020 [Streptomyces yanii]
MERAYGAEGGARSGCRRRFPRVTGRVRCLVPFSLPPASARLMITVPRLRGPAFTAAPRSRSAKDAPAFGQRIKVAVEASSTR